MNEQIRHYENKLVFETDSADLKAALDGGEDLIVVDTRSSEAYQYQKEHIPGAINIPHRQMSYETTKHLSMSVLIFTYCDGIGCNGSTKGALNLAKLGFRVKELIGGLDWWKRDGHVTEGGGTAAASGACGCN